MRPLWRKTLAAASLVVAASVVPAESQASDHIDGLKTAFDNAADITDVFAFTSPSDPNRLVMIMNVHPLAFGGSRFSNAVEYKLRIRPIADARTLAASADPRQERSVVCTFSGGLPLVKAKQRATCRFTLEDGTEVITFDTRSEAYAAGGEARQGSTRIFAGVRSDPWFLDLAKTLKFNAGLPVLDVASVNGLWGQNVLSIVVEVDKRRLPGPLLAISAQTVRR